MIKYQTQHAFKGQHPVLSAKIWKVFSLLKTLFLFIFDFFFHTWPTQWHSSQTWLQDELIELEWQQKRNINNSILSAFSKLTCGRFFPLSTITHWTERIFSRKLFFHLWFMCPSRLMSYSCGVFVIFKPFDCLYCLCHFIGCLSIVEPFFSLSNLYDTFFVNTRYKYFDFSIVVNVTFHTVHSVDLMVFNIPLNWAAIVITESTNSMKRQPLSSSSSSHSMCVHGYC